MMEFRICCEDLEKNLYDPDGQTWGISLSQNINYPMSNYVPPLNKICVIHNGMCTLFDIRFCPYCGKQLQLVESLCKHEVEE